MVFMKKATILCLFLLTPFVLKSQQKDILRVSSSIIHQTEVGSFGYNLGLEIPIIKRLTLAPSYSNVSNTIENEYNLDLRGSIILKDNVEWYALGGLGITRTYCCGVNYSIERYGGANVGIGFNVKPSNHLKLNTQGKFFYSLYNPYFLFQAGISYGISRRK